MSIIYEALRKSQHARSIRKSNLVARARAFKPNRKQLAISMLLLSGLTFLTILFILATSNFNFASIAAETPVPITKPKSFSAFKAPRLILDGVFLSNTEKLAMINRRAYHIGDHLFGMRVASISLEKVVLKGSTHSIVLQNSLAQLD